MAAELLNRRRVLARAGALAITCAAFARRLPAAEPLSPQDPTARGLMFTEDAALLDTAKTPLFKPGSSCANCALYVKAQAANEHAPCITFGNRLVPAKGWCASWAKA